MKKSYLLIAIALIATLLLGACGQATDVPATSEPVVEPTEAPVVDEPTDVPVVEPTEAPVEEPAATLRIWADEQRAPVLTELGAEFEATYNVAVIVESIAGIRDQFLVAAPAGEGPDIIVIAHDQMPALTESGLLAEIDLGAKEADFTDQALKAFSYEGKLYGLPYATENLGFFYNKDYVEDVPTTWQGIYDLSQELIAAGTVEYGMVFGGTSYDAYPWMTSQGGYVFGVDENGDYDPMDVGVDSPGMIAFGEMALQWKEDGVLSDNLDNTTAKSMFLNGDVAFFMNGPWEINNLKEAGTNYGITNFPDGGVPFMGVQGFAVNSMSDNVQLAQSFLTEFIATEEGMLALYDAEPRAPAYLPALAQVDNEDLKAIGEAGANAQPMPAIPEMAKVWGDWGNALTFIFDGSKTPEEAYTFAAEAIRSAIAIDTVGMVNLPGSWQTAAGFDCDWNPGCPATVMVLGDDGLYTFSASVPAGDYEIKVALDGGWDTNYGVDGVAGGDNIPFTVATEGEVTFIFDPETHLLEIVLP